jgi:2-polyprenyl-3-methyl-5-hydroxy-6-metoxy-1,4-benzoquinol methylase
VAATATRKMIELPSWWAPVLRRSTGVHDFDPATLKQFVPSLENLSAHLNDLDDRRGMPPHYMRDRRMRAAYQLYYVTANLLKPLWALGELWPSGPPAGDGPLRVLDLGCGPGTGVAAMHAWCEHVTVSRPIHIEGIDAVEANAVLYRELGRLLAEESGHEIGCDSRRGDASRPSSDAGPYDLVIAMNLLNELPAPERFLSHCSDLLAPEGVLLLIEPALRTTSRGLLRLRDSAVQEGWQVLLPCFRQSTCPALINEKDWCHHDLPWVRPPYIAWLDEAIGNIKKSLKFSCLALRRIQGEIDSTQAPQQPSHRCTEPQRVVSELFVEKGRSWCYCCGASGRRVYQRNTRDRDNANAAFDLLRRYDAVCLSHAEERSHDVRIHSGTQVWRLGDETAAGD